jgi:predicted Zn-dependent peptidase
MSTIWTGTLECGMPLLIERMSGVESAGLSWLLPAGSATDPADRLGLAPMLAELVFRGAGTLDSRAQADALDRLGLSRDCDVGSRHLRLSASMQARTVVDALPALVDIVRRPRLDEASIDPARDLAIQSVESLSDDPHERAVVEIRRLHNDPPLNRSHLGTVEGLEAITRDDLAAQWERRVRPVGSVLAIAGAIDDARREEIVRTLNRLLAGWSGAAPDVATTASATKGSYEHAHDDKAQVQIVLMHDAPREADPACPLERVAGGVLSGGMSARLFTEVREKRGLCYSVSASYATDRDSGRVLAYVGTTPERAQQSLDVLWDELNRINRSEGKVEPDEFERALTGIKSGIVFSGESTSARAGALATDYFRLGRARSLAELSATFDRVTLADLDRYLSGRRLGPVTIFTLGPAQLTAPQRHGS